MEIPTIPDSCVISERRYDSSSTVLFLEELRLVIAITVAYHNNCYLISIRVGRDDKH